MMASVSITAREYGRLLGVEAVEKLAHLGPAWKAPARGQRHQFDTAASQSRVSSPSSARSVSGPSSSSNSAQVAQRQGLAGADQRGFEDALRILCVHGSCRRASPHRR
jgi:hypothetical protein